MEKPFNGQNYVKRMGWKSKLIFYLNDFNNTCLNQQLNVFNLQIFHYFSNVY